MLPRRAVALLLCLQPWLLTGGCAAGKGTPLADPDGGRTDGQIGFPDGGRRDGEAGPAPDRGGDLDPSSPDKDGDGHCPPGASDPQKVCKSLSDCDDSDKERYPGAPETCADLGVDNDCDTNSGDVDEDGDGKDDLQTPCSTGLPGVCAAGTRQCSAGKLVCVGAYQVGQQSEACNGDDDNCDGQTDEGTLCPAGHTCAGAAGCRCGAGPACAAAQSCCPAGCFDLSTSAQACGACGVACGSNESCSGGACSCGATVGTQGGGPACPGNSCDGTSCAPCNPATNLALTATASSSGGGYVAGYEPAQLNNGLLEASCKFHWVTASSTPAGAWVEYSWSQPVSVNNVWFDTAAGAACGMSAGRTLAGGTIQYWSGGAWQTAGSVAGRTGDWSYSFTKVSTTKLRLYNLVATTSGIAMNPMIFEWQVFCK